MTGARNIDDGLEWFELFTATWGDAFEGTIIGGPPSTPPREVDMSPQLTTYVAYTTGDLTAVPRNDRGPLWFVDEKITRHVAEQAHSWAYTRGCQQYLGREGDFCKPVGHELGLALAHAICYDFVSVELQCLHHRPFRGRLAGWRPHGTAVYQVIDPTQGWRERLATLREVLLWTPPHTDLAMTRYSAGCLLMWDPVVSWPHLREPDVRYNRPLLASFVPDVSGIQVLTDAHLERATNLDAWSITPLAGGRHLVETRDMEAWFSTTGSALGRARRSPRGLRRHDPDPRGYRRQLALARRLTERGNLPPKFTGWGKAAKVWSPPPKGTP